MGTPLGAGTRSSAPFCDSATGLCSAASEGRSAAPVSEESGSGAERIAAISGRGTGCGAQIPPRSLARTALVIHARSSTRRSSASATRSSDWL